MSDLRGASRLALAGIAGIVDIVEAMHGNIASLPRRRAGNATTTRTSGLTGLIYRSIRGGVGLVGMALDALLGRLAPLLGERSSWPGREPVVAALNGVLGDYLDATASPLATAMALVASAPAEPGSSKVAVFIHGLCLDERSWLRDGHDYGAGLARDLGFAPLHVRYNTGRHVAANGRELADRLEQWSRSPDGGAAAIVMVVHSMGGLVARSACHHAELAGHEWRRRLTHVVFLGTPHHGAPLERGGHWLDILLHASRYTAPLSRLGRIRSAGITDLRHGSAHPLPQGVACHAIAATTSSSEGAVGEMIGDGLVPVASALGRHADPGRTLAFDESRQWIARGVGHLELLGNPAVFARIRDWLSA